MNEKQSIRVKIKGIDRFTAKSGEEYIIVRCLKGEDEEWEDQDVFVFASNFPKDRWDELVVDEEVEVIMITKPSKQRPDNKLLVDLMVADEGERKKQKRS